MTGRIDDLRWEDTREERRALLSAIAEFGAMPFSREIATPTIADVRRFGRPSRENPEAGIKRIIPRGFPALLVYLLKMTREGRALSKITDLYSEGAFLVHNEQSSSPASGLVGLLSEEDAEEIGAAIKDGEAQHGEDE